MWRAAVPKHLQQLTPLCPRWQPEPDCFLPLSPFVMMGSLGKAHGLTVGVSFLPSGDPKPGSRKVHGSTRGRLWRASLPGLKGFSI